MFCLCNFNLSVQLFDFLMLGNEVPVINTVARNSRLPTNEGYVSLMYGKYALYILCTYT